MEKIALLPGGFKPPHAGHYNMAKWLASNTDADTVLIKVGAKERNGITREMSLKLWDLYRTTDSDSISNKLTILPSTSNSPVQDVYDFIETEVPEDSIVYLGVGKKDFKDKRYANISKFAEPKGIKFFITEVPPQAGGVSGTDMRDFIKSNRFQDFSRFIPDHLTQEQKNEAWAIVTGNTDYSSPKGGTQSSQFEENFSKEWWSNQLTEVFSNNQATINDQLVPLEIMTTPEDHMTGMMGRDSLDGGMLFPYGEAGQRSFHMKNCLIPLDIVFITKDEITNIHHNCPPCSEDNCPQYTGLADNVLELEGGYCEKNNINVGDYIEFPTNSSYEVGYHDYAKSNDLGPKTPVEPAYKYKRRNFPSSMYESLNLNELEDHEIKFFAMHADILKQLNTPNFKLKFIELQQELEGERLEALEYFWDEYFSNLEDSCEIEGSFDKKVRETKYGAHDSISQHKDKIQSDYGHQKYRDLQFMISQQKDEEVNNWLKTKGYMNETRLFSKNWWSNIINEILLTEGGAAGHMAHPFDLPNVNSGEDLKDIFVKAAVSLKTSPGAVKIDGVNSSIRLVDLDGQKQFVMDRGSKKPLDIKGITKADLEDRFKPGHGMVKVGGKVLDMFNEALPSIQNDLMTLGAWEDPNILFNMEYVEGKSNVQDYGSNFIAIHGLNKMETKEVQGKRQMLTKRFSTEFNYDKTALQSLLDNLAPIAKEKGFEVYGSVPTEMDKEPNFSSALSKQYTVVSNEENKTQTLDRWLGEINSIPKDDFIFMNVNSTKKKVGAVSKQVYLAILKGENVDELFEEENDKQKAIDGFTTYLATEKLGDEILKVLNSPMGSVEDHEGVVIRDKNIYSEPFKITGKFILGGLISDF